VGTRSKKNEEWAFKGVIPSHFASLFPRLTKQVWVRATIVCDTKWF